MNTWDVAELDRDGVTVVIIHYRAPQWCDQAVRSVLESEGVNVEVVVVDNSGDLPAMPREVTVLRPAENLGYAGGANLALREWLKSSRKYCFVAAHDLAIEPHTLRNLVSTADRNTDFGVIAPWFTPRVARVGELGEVDGMTEFSWVSGSGYLLRRSMLEEVGLFDEDFGSYCEDREMCMRARIHGWRVGALHNAPASSRGSAHRDTAQVMMHGNQILLRVKYRDRNDALHLLWHETRSVPLELAKALSPSKSSRAALRRARIHAATVVLASRKVIRWKLRGGMSSDPLSAGRFPPSVRAKKSDRTGLSATKLRIHWFLATLSQKELSRRTLNDAIDAAKVIRRDMTLKAAGRTVGTPKARHLLIVDQTFPDPTKDSGSDRIIRLAKIAKHLGYPTVVASITHRHWASIDSDDPASIRLPPEPVRWTDEQFWKWVENSSVIWLSRPDVAGRLLPTLSRAATSRRVIYDTVDLYHTRLERKALLTRKGSDRRASRAFKRLEESAVKSADVTLTVTEVEQQALHELVRDARVDVIPNVHEVRSKPVPPRASRKGLIFYGSYRHAPNVDAVEYLYSTIMPAIWNDAPDTELTVIGDRLPQRLAVQADPRVHVLGWVEDLLEHVDASVALIAPLRFGAGLKGKIGFAMANGLPVVTTAIGAEGLAMHDGISGLIGQDEADLISKCLTILSDDSQWDAISKAGVDAIESTLSVRAVTPMLKAALDRHA